MIFGDSWTSVILAGHAGHAGHAWLEMIGSRTVVEAQGYYCYITKLLKEGFYPQSVSEAEGGDCLYNLFAFDLVRDKGSITRSHLHMADFPPPFRRAGRAAFT